MANLSPEVIAMRRTCFVCYGAEGKKNSLTYHEISRKIEGEEFFLFLSSFRPDDELPLKELYRHIVSSSRLGNPSRFFRELAESVSMEAEDGRNDSWLDETCILMVWKKGEEAFLFRNKRVEPVHFDSETGQEGSIQSLDGRVEIGLQKDGSQVDLFEKKYGDHFTLDQFSIRDDGHTLLFAPSRDFVRRNREALLDSVLFPSFGIPVSGELEVDTDTAFAGMHWGSARAVSDVPERKKRGVEIMKASVPMAAGAVALVVAILLIFKPFGGNEDQSGNGEEILLSPAANTDAGEMEITGDDGAVEEISSGAEGGDPAPPPTVERDLTEGKVVLREGWKKKFGAAVTSSPVVCGDNVTFGCRDGNLYCFTLDGNIKWKYTAVTGVGATPACVGDRIIGADYEGNVFCLEAADGSRIWNYRGGAKIVSSPVVRGSTVITCTMDGRVISLDLETGERRWSQKIGDQVWATPSIGKDYIVAASTDGSLVRLALDGKVVWRVAPGGTLHSSPLCIEKEDLLVVGTGDRYLIGYSLSKGMLMWRYGAGSEVRSAPVLSSGKIVAGTEDGILVAVDLNGKLLWKKDMGEAIRSRPLVIGEMIAVTSYNSKLSILSSADGSIMAEYRADGPIYSSPAYYDGRVFFGSNGGFLHAPTVTTTGG